MKTIYARKTTIKELAPKEALAFTDKYHRQGKPGKTSNPFFYGLTYNDELLAVLIIANPRTKAMQRKYCHEISRLTFKKDIRIPGGASKLIKHFIKDENPYNLFTYQSLTGEVTDVYQNAGMKLVSEKTTKQILLHNSINDPNDAQNNRKDWFSLEQASRYGPDALLGTNLNEKYQNNKRLNNIELFTELLNYRLVSVPGDRLYEWHNPNRWHYVYKITATDSPKYYIGRKGIDKDSPSINDCINDGYFGSGGNKYQNWLNKHQNHLQKEILLTTNIWSNAVEFEEAAIGDNYKTDKNCLNSHPGGIAIGSGNGKVYYDICPTHGNTKHRNGICFTCAANKPINMQICQTHGYTKHRANKCCKCLGEKIKKTHKITIKNCPIHGNVKHNGNSCSTCNTIKANNVKKANNYQQYIGNCSIHGEIVFRKDKCSACIAEQTFEESNCIIHGPGSHRYGRCVACLNSSYINFKECSKHQTQPHVDEACFVCSRDKNIAKGYYELQIDAYNYTAICPDCGEAHNINKKLAKTYSKALRGDTVCPMCGYWQKSDIHKLLKKFIREPISYKNFSQYAKLKTQCPECSQEEITSLNSFMKKVKRGTPLCRNCKTPITEYLTKYIQI